MCLTISGRYLLKGEIVGVISIYIWNETLSKHETLLPELSPSSSWRCPTLKSLEWTHKCVREECPREKTSPEITPRNLLSVKILQQNCPPPTPPSSRKIATRKITLKKAALLAKSITKVRKKDLVRFSKTFKIRFKFEYLKIA